EQRKDTFIQNISHELRTPLGIVLGHAELLESGMLGDLEAAQQESIGIVARRVQMLVALVEDLSVMLAAQTQEFRREMLHPKQMVDAMLADFHLQAEARGLQLVAQVAEKLPWIRGDSTHLRRVFDNLMSNAFKFTPQGGQVQLTVWQQEGNVLFEVRDTGMGMPANQLTHIFDRFYQVKYKDHVHPGGTGLGLSLVKEIVEAHRGEIRVESEEGRGAAFIIRLPGVIHEEAPALEHGDGGAGEALGDLDARGEGVA
ncbi:MAG: HAMP domain-containing histidine kinase, partial [Anaerolineales bacterium]|nr:HAMP domain-containing histidine kinase [Anaerolineales bacterium]